MKRLIPICGVLAACASAPTAELASPERQATVQWHAYSTFLEPINFVEAIPRPDLTLNVGSWTHPSPLLRSPRRPCPAAVIRVGADGGAERAIEMPAGEIPTLGAHCLSLPAPVRALPNKR